MNVNDDTSKIVIINDGCKSYGECPSLEDFQVYQELMRIGDEDDELEGEESDSSSDDEAGMEARGHIDEEQEAENFVPGSQEGPGGMAHDDDDDDIGVAEARAAVK